MSKQKVISLKSKKISGGLIALMVWQVVVVIYCSLNLCYVSQFGLYKYTNFDPYR